MVDRITNRCDIMLFGALGDLAQRKLFPAFYQLERADLLADDSRILALARQDIDTAIFRKQCRGLSIRFLISRTRKRSGC